MTPSIRRIFTVKRLIFLLFLVCAVLGFRLIKPAVPMEFDLLAGPLGSTFYSDALRYRQILARHGVTLNVIETSGSVDNLRRLTEAERPTAAFADAVQVVQDKVGAQTGGISSLGTLYLQPLWFFVTKGAGIEDLTDLRGHRVAPGRKGGSARMLAVFLMDATGLEEDVDIVQVDGSGDDPTVAEALDALRTKRVAAIIATGLPDSPLIDGLLRETELDAFPVSRSEAIALRFQFLRVVRLPEGAHDLKANIPTRDLQLLAAGTELLVADQFPPVLTDLLLEAGAEIHGEPTLFSRRGEFPTPDMVSLPLNLAASHYFKDGPPALREVLPFQLATLVDRFFTMAVALGSAALALFGLLPKLLAMPFNLSLKKVYRRLEVIEKSMATDPDRAAVIAELNALDRISAGMRVPMKTLEAPWFELRQNIHDFRDRLDR